MKTSVQGLRRLRRTLALALALAASALSGPAGAQPASPGPLVEPAQLHALLAQHAALRIVDLRDADDYAAGHLPGAVDAPYGDWRGDADNPGKLLPLADFTRLVRTLGLHRDDQVVLVSAGGDPTDFGIPARVYWTLKWLGLRQLSILNGGMQSWKDAGYAELQRGSVQVVASDFQPQLDDSVLATREQVAQLTHDATGSTLLLDARPPAFWKGQAKAPAALQPGTIAGAQDFSNFSWFPQGGGALPAPAMLRVIARGLPAQQARETVSFCNTGHWAATNWFVLSELLLRPGVRLYPGSMVDWSRHDEPMTHVPSRIDQLWAQLKQTWQAR